METKTQKAITAYKLGDVKTALRIVKDFRAGITPEERKVFSKGYEALVWPGWCDQLKQSRPEMVDAAKALFEEKIIPKPQQPDVLGVSYAK